MNPWEQFNKQNSFNSDSLFRWLSVWDFTEPSVESDSINPMTEIDRYPCS
jgi:hypothetical protein